MKRLEPTSLAPSTGCSSQRSTRVLRNREDGDVPKLAGILTSRERLEADLIVELERRLAESARPARLDRLELLVHGAAEFKDTAEPDRGLSSQEIMTCVAGLFVFRQCQVFNKYDVL